MLLNVLNKPNEFVARSESKLIPIPSIDLPEAIEAEGEKQAEQLKTPTNCKTVTIEECLTLPAGTVFNSKCKIIIGKKFKQKYLSFIMPPTLKKGDILVSACPYVCMYVCMYVFMFEVSS